MREYIFIQLFGGVWRLSPRSYQKLRRDIADGREWNLDDYGKQITSNIVNGHDLPDDVAGN